MYKIPVQGPALLTPQQQLTRHSAPSSQKPRRGGGKKWRGREEADVSIQLLPAAPLVTLGWTMDPGA